MSTRGPSYRGPGAEMRGLARPASLPSDTMSGNRKGETMSALRAGAAAGALVFALAGTASATTYYVATTGNDSANGSSTAPWQTLQHAVETIAPGDVILVRSGTYAGCRIRSSGTTSAPKTLSRDIGAAVVVNTPGQQNSHSSLIEVEDGSGSEVTDWIVDGLEIANSPHHGIDLRITNRITVRNCYVHHSAVGGTGTGIFLAFSAHATIENNESAFN